MAGLNSNGAIQCIRPRCRIIERRQAGGGSKRRQYSPGPALLHGEIDPIEIIKESLFDFLCHLKFRPRFFNIGIARESLQ
jgi:hypothetical protein